MVDTSLELVRRSLPFLHEGGAGQETGAKARAGRVVGATCLLLALAVGLGGCDLPPYTVEPPTPTVEVVVTASPEPTETLPPGITTISFWEPFPLDRPQGLLLGEMVRDFETENPDVLVEIMAKSGYGAIHSAILAQLPGASVPLPDVELPNLAVAFPSMIAEYAAAGVVLPLDSFFVDPEVGLSDEDLVDIYPGYLEAGRFPGYGRQVLAFPFVYNAIGMWVNETLLSQAGWETIPVTWHEFEQACFDIVAHTGVGCYPFVESVSTFNAWLYSRGGRQLDESGQGVAFNGPAGVESLALLRRLMDAGLAWRPLDPYGDYVAFANGEAAFAFSSTGNKQLYADAYQAALRRGMAPFGWRQTLIPQADLANPATALVGSSFFILRSDPEREWAAWRLVRWFTDTAQTARWAGLLEAMPVRASALEVMTDTLQAYPFVQAQIQEILPYGQPEPAVAAELEIRDLIYTAIISVTQGTADPQTALDQAANKAQTVLSAQP